MHHKKDGLLSLIGRWIPSRGALAFLLAWLSMGTGVMDSGAQQPSTDIPPSATAPVNPATRAVTPANAESAAPKPEPVPPKPEVTAPKPEPTAPKPETAAPAPVSVVTAPVPGQITPESIQAKIGEATQELRSLQEILDASPPVRPPEVLAEIQKQIDLLSQIAQIEGQQLSMLKRVAGAETLLKQAKDNLDKIRMQGPDEKPPYSYVQLDRLRDELKAEKDQEKSVSGILNTAQDIQKRALAQSEEKAAVYRRVKDTLDANPDPEAAALLQVQLRTALLDRKMAQEITTLRDLETKAAQARVETYKLRLQWMEERIRWIQQTVFFTQADLDAQLAQYDKSEATLKEEMEKQRKALEAADKKLADLLDNPASTPEKEEEINARRLEREAAQVAVSTMETRLSWLPDRRRVWKQRFEIINGTAERGQITPWRQEAVKALDLLKERDNSLNVYMSVLRNRMINLLTRRDSLMEPSKTLVKWMDEQKASMEKQISFVQDILNSLAILQRDYGKLISEIDEVYKSWSLSDWLAYAGDKFEDILNTEIYVYKTTLEDGSTEETSFRIRTIISIILYFAIGILAIRFFSYVLLKRILSRLGVHESAQITLQPMSFYLLLIVLTFYTLHVYQIPLTMFAVVGGAVAIGIGFGTQTIFNNFISGLIILMERPIRVGDLIDMDGTMGTVVRIGARCTQVRAFNNIDVLLPNSKILENKVINWTLSDDMYRTSVALGVAYGSPPRDVFRIMKKAVDEHGLILKKPEPFVVFRDFGESALLFEVFFWIHLENTNRLIVESDIRHRLDHLFREAGISLAFPQRDLHLDTPAPLRIQMVHEDSAKGA
ncbi:MAG: mechanosensitive ion channel domain-containing protein [bacterium]